jgi:hypothetical protein
MSRLLRVSIKILLETIFDRQRVTIRIVHPAHVVAGGNRRVPSLS